MKTLVVAVRIFCLLPFATGIADLLVGPEVFALSGSTFPETVMNDPALNSQIGFWGAVWFGTGLLLWECSNDLVRYGDWLQLLCAIVFLSGIGRAIAAARFGLPPTPLTVAMALELIGMPLALLWHRAVLRRLDRADSAERAT